MSHTFGIYISTVGVVVLFSILLVIAFVIKAIKSLIIIIDKNNEDLTLDKVAGLSAVLTFIHSNEHHPLSRRTKKGGSLWSVVARRETLDKTGDDQI